MRGFFKSRPAVSHKNTPGQRVRFEKPDHTGFFTVNTGGRRERRALTYSITHLVVPTGWIRFDHRLERKRRAL